MGWIGPLQPVRSPGSHSWSGRRRAGRLLVAAAADDDEINQVAASEPNQKPPLGPALEAGPGSIGDIESGVLEECHRSLTGSRRAIDCGQFVTDPSNFMPGRLVVGAAGAGCWNPSGGCVC